MGKTVTRYIDTFSLDPPPSVVDFDLPPKPTAEEQAKIDALIKEGFSTTMRWSQMIESRYSADQPRDPDGRWSGGADNGGAPKMFAENLYTPNEYLYKHLISDGKGGWKVDASQSALHEQILKGLSSQVPSTDHPIAYIMGGGSGAGKSTAMNDPTIGVPSPESAVRINPDDIQELLPDYKAAVAAGDPAAATNAHEEASYLSKQLVSLSIANSQSYVLDGTGDKSVISAQSKIDFPRANGYEVHGLYVTCPTQVAVDRAQARGDQTGRYVDPAVIELTHDKVSEIVPAVASSFDTFALVDTTHTAPGDPVHVIMSATRDQPITVHDAAAYQTFLDKASK